MSQKKSERRQRVRFDVEGLHGGVRLPSDARIVDLGFGGLGVETDRWLQVGRGYMVSLPTDRVPLRVQGTVAWCRLARTAKNRAGESAPVYKAGIEFQDPDPATIDAIERLLSSSARVDGSEDTLRGRFRYRREDSVDVELGHPFIVRKLSLTGMLVEAGFHPAAEERFRLAIDLGEQVLDVNARVAYVDRALDDEGGHAARIGIEFLDLDGDQKRLLRSVIRSEVASSSAPFVGSPETGIYHRSDCRHAAACSATYETRRKAERAGLRAGSCCAE
jgi:Tfp pilus assembly protein PilZ